MALEGLWTSVLRACFNNAKFVAGQRVVLLLGTKHAILPALPVSSQLSEGCSMQCCQIIVATLSSAFRRKGKAQYEGEPSVPGAALVTAHGLPILVVQQPLHPAVQRAHLRLHPSVQQCPCKTPQTHGTASGSCVTRPELLSAAFADLTPRLGRL